MEKPSGQAKPNAEAMDDQYDELGEREGASGLLWSETPGRAVTMRKHVLPKP